MIRFGGSSQGMFQLLMLLLMAVFLLVPQHTQNWSGDLRSQQQSLKFLSCVTESLGQVSTQPHSLFTQQDIED